MNRKKYIFIILFIYFCTCINAYAENNYKYSKKIIVDDSEGYKEFYLDEDIYRYTNEEMSDIRILDYNEEEVPYYIVDEQSFIDSVNYKYNLKSILEYKKYDNRYFDFEVRGTDENTDVLANEIFIELNSNEYMKKLSIYGSYDNKKWEHIRDDILYKVPEASSNNIYLGKDYKYGYYRVVFIDDLDYTKIINIDLVYNNKYIKYKKYYLSKNIEYEVENESEDKKTIIDIKNKDRLKLKSIKIISDDLYSRSYTLAASKSEDEYYNIDNGKIYNIKLDGFESVDNNIEINRFLREEDLRLTIYNNDDRPIKIDNIEVEYYIDKLVFKKEVGEYKIIFGNYEDLKPNYDIETYREHIEISEDKEECILGELIIENETPKKEYNYKIILNIFIVLISFSLIILIVKRLKN